LHAILHGKGVDTAFQNYVAISNGFLGSLINAGAFDAMLPSMVRFPVHPPTMLLAHFVGDAGAR
jgi:hypothetical protein